MGARPAPDPVLQPGDFQAAERAYEAVLKKAPNDGAAIAGLARIRLYQERRSEARTLAQQALAADPNNALANRVLAGVMQREAAFAPNVYQIDLPKDGARIPFEATDPLPVVKVRVGGKDVYFLIDTGGPDLVLDKDFAAELSLPLQTGGQGTFAGGMMAGFARAQLPVFEIGAVKVGNVPVSVLPTRGLAPTPGLRIDGIIGTGFMMHFLSTIDYRGGALVLKPRGDSPAFEANAATDGSTVVTMWLVGDHFLFARGHVGKAPEGLFNIDTGLAGGGVQATRATMDAAGIVPDASNATTGRGGGGMVRTIPFTADASLGPLTVKNVPGVYTPDGDQFGIFPFTVAGTLSHSFFRQTALTFDFVAMKIVVH